MTEEQGERIATALERIADQLTANADMAQAHRDAVANSPHEYPIRDK